jgi:hypothetical protein
LGLFRHGESGKAAAQIGVGCASKHGAVRNHSSWNRSGSYGGFPNQSSYKKGTTMSTEKVTYAFQVAGTTGVGVTPCLCLEAGRSCYRVADGAALLGAPEVAALL